MLGKRANSKITTIQAADVFIDQHIDFYIIQSKDQSAQNQCSQDDGNQNFAELGRPVVRTPTKLSYNFTNIKSEMMTNKNPHDVFNIHGLLRTLEILEPTISL